jgi:hypothetical protein
MTPAEQLATSFFGYLGRPGVAAIARPQCQQDVVVLRDASHDRDYEKGQGIDTDGLRILQENWKDGDHGYLGVLMDSEVQTKHE